MSRPREDRELVTLTCLLVAIIFILGAMAGWAIRTTSDNHRLQAAAMEAYLAEKNYYKKQAEQIIGEAQTKIAKENKHAR